MRILLLIAVVLGCEREAGASAGATVVYTCPMHPSVRQDRPGICPICKMDLVPVRPDENKGGVVSIDDAQRKMAGIRTVVVEERELEEIVRAVGKVAYDETRLRDISLRIGGWVDDIAVDQPGLVVRAGQRLFSLHSPELIQAQAEHLRAEGEIKKASRARLLLWGLTDAQVDELETRGTPWEKVPMLSPQAGVVVEKDLVPGARVEAGVRLLRLARLDRVWIEADVFSADIATIAPGQLAKIDGREGKVARVLPAVEGAARAARVRIDLENNDGALRPGQAVDVEIKIASTKALQIPAGAVIWTGRRRVVFVDDGNAKLSPRAIEIGRRTNESVEITSGLKAGEKVVADGVFLVAAESRLRAPGAFDAQDVGPAPAPASPERMP